MLKLNELVTTYRCHPVVRTMPDSKSSYNYQNKACIFYLTYLFDHICIIDMKNPLRVLLLFCWSW